MNPKREIARMSAVVIVISSAVSIYTHFTRDLFFEGKLYGIYDLYFLPPPLFVIWAFPLVPILILLGVVILAHYLFDSNTLRLVAAFLLLTGLTLSLYLGMAAVFDCTGHAHDSAITVNNSVYRLGSRIPFETRQYMIDGCGFGESYDASSGCYPGAWDQEYAIFECDSLGLICRAIHHQTFCEALYRSEGSLTVGDDGTTLIFSVDGISMWEHQAEP